LAPADALRYMPACALVSRRRVIAREVSCIATRSRDRPARMWLQRHRTLRQRASHLRWSPSGWPGARFTPEAMPASLGPIYDTRSGLTSPPRLTVFLTADRNKARPPGGGIFLAHDSTVDGCHSCVGGDPCPTTSSRACSRACHSFSWTACRSFLALNFLGDTLRDIWDPKLRGSE